MAEHLHAQRVARFLRRFDGAMSIEKSKLREILEDPLLDTDREPAKEESEQRAIARVLNDVEQLGFTITELDCTIEVRQNDDPAEAHRFTASRRDVATHRTVSTRLAEIEPNRIPVIDPGALLKRHRYATLQLLLSDRSTMTGVLYLVDGATPNLLLIRCDDGRDVAVPANVVVEATVLRSNGPSVTDGDPAPPQVERLPEVDGFNFRQRRGRPGTDRTVQNAEAVITAIYDTTPVDSSGEDAKVSLTVLSQRTGFDVPTLKSLSRPVTQRDDNIYLEGDHYYRMRSTDPSTQFWSGPDSYLAAQELVKFKALDTGCEELAPDIAISDVDELLDRLVEFLTLIRFEVTWRPAPYAKNIVAAVLCPDGYSLDITTADGAEGSLRCDGLHWSDGRWWCTGTFNGKQLLAVEMAMDSITSAD